MLPGIIPVGVTVPAFSYKEGFTGSLASGGTATISLATPASQYRWIIISAGFGQSSTNTLSQIQITVNGFSLTEVFGATSNDSGGTGSTSTAHVPVRLFSGSSFTLSLSNSLGIAMNYTVGVFEIPVLTLQYITASASFGASPYIASGPTFQGGIVIASFFGQGGGTWSNITFTGMTKVPVASSAQEALAYLYAPVTGTFNISSDNSATFNRIITISTWAPA